MSIKLKAYKFRLYPNKSQDLLLNKTFGCVRYFWNSQVFAFNSYNKETNPNPIFKTSTQLRNEIEWMQEVSAGAIQQKEIDFKEYKKQRFSKNRKKAISNPKFKKKNGHQSYRLPNQKFYIKDNKIQLERIGKIKIVLDRELPINGKFMSVTISKNPSNQYFASVLMKVDINELNKTNKSVALDVGLKEFYTSSDGEVVKNPRYFRKSQSKLKRLQQRLSKKKKGTVRRRKFKLKIAKLHQKISNQRYWFLHQQSIDLIRRYDVIYIEDLNIQGMVKNHKLSKSISDVSFSKFFNMLNYKANWYGKQIVTIGRFEPTSKKCSSCGWIKHDLTLKDRIFNCDECGLSLDRDYNAALNIFSVGVDAEVKRTQRETLVSR